MALHIGGRDNPMPEEVGDYVLCVEMYHCRPSELDDEDAFRLQDDLAIRAGINKARNARS